MPYMQAGISSSLPTDAPLQDLPTCAWFTSKCNITSPIKRPGRARMDGWVDMDGSCAVNCMVSETWHSSC